IQTAKASPGQERLLPFGSSAPPGVRIASHYRPAATAGGDWFGYSYDPGDHTLNIYIGDVTGHGVSSSIITGVACGAIYGAEAANGYSDHSPTITIENKLMRLAAAVNSVIYHTGRPNKLMTMAFVSVQLDTGLLNYINCGHPPIFVCGQDQKIRSLIQPSAHLGQCISPNFRAKAMQLNPGDSVFAYTDGLLENEGVNSQKLSDRCLRELLASGLAPHDLCEKILAAADSVWRDTPLADDVTLSIFQWEGPITREDFQSQLKTADRQTLWGIKDATKAQ
ncbi:MAG: PP2C family protein-serine/threonine phosphatase, partial [Pseudomonadota bacterium]